MIKQWREVRVDLQEYQGKTPNLRVRSRSSPGLDLELASFGVVAIAVDAAEQELYFVWLQEAPCGLLCDLFWEVYHEDVAEQTDADRQYAFDDENPPPAVVACYASLMDVQSVAVRAVTLGEKSYHLLKAVCKHARESVTQGSNEIEESVSFLHVVAGIVSREKVDTAYQRLASFDQMTH